MKIGNEGFGLVVQRRFFGMGGMYRVAITVILLLVQSMPAVAAVSYDSSINYYENNAYAYIDSDGTDDAYVDYQSFSGGVGSGWTLANGNSFGLTHGYANAGNLKQGVSAQVFSTTLNNHLSDASISTDASNRLTVLSGSSGLTEGDTTTLTLKVRLDGSLHAEATSYPGKGWASAEMSGGLTVRDYAIKIDTGEGYYIPKQASFGASCELESYDVYQPIWGYSYSSNWSKSWSYNSNISDGDNYSNSGSTKSYGDSFHYEDGFSFDTGEITLSFEAIVGHTLDFDSYMYLYVDASNDAMSWADFSKTFGFDVTADTGVALQWEVVPEPATILLLTLGGLFLRNKRR